MESEVLEEMATATYPADYRGPYHSTKRPDKRAEKMYTLTLWSTGDVFLDVDDAHTFAPIEKHHYINIGGLAYANTICKRPEEWLDELRLQAKEQGSKEEA